MVAIAKGQAQQAVEESKRQAEQLVVKKGKDKVDRAEKVLQDKAEAADKAVREHVARKYGTCVLLYIHADIVASAKVPTLNKHDRDRLPAGVVVCGTRRMEH